MKNKIDLINYRRTPSTQQKTAVQEQKNKLEAQENIMKTINNTLDWKQDQLYGSDINYRLYK